MRAIDLIEKKRDGRELSSGEIRFLIEGSVAGVIPDYQMSAWLMAAYLNGMSVAETVALTEALVESGNRLDLSDLGHVVDKHSTGGVGDKTTLIVAPIVASLGVPVAKLSGRALGHTGGTIDKLESIPGMRTTLSLSEMKDQVRQIGIAVSSASQDLAAGDKKLYALRDATGTVASPGLIAASVMSKKIAGGASALVLDVKVGSGAFLKDIEEARQLAQLMIEIGSSFSLGTTAVLTSMDDVLGEAVGNSLEVAEAIDVLSGRGPSDLIEVCEALAAAMLVAGGAARTGDEGVALVREAVASGRALEVFERWIEAQGGRAEIVAERSLLPAAACRGSFVAESTGIVESVDAEAVGSAAGLLGAARASAEGRIDHAAGIVIRAKLGDPVQAGGTVAELFSADSKSIEAAKKMLAGAWKIGGEKPVKRPMIIDTIPQPK